MGTGFCILRATEHGLITPGATSTLARAEWYVALRDAPLETQQRFMQILHSLYFTIDLYSCGPFSTLMKVN